MNNYIIYKHLALLSMLLTSITVMSDTQFQTSEHVNSQAHLVVTGTVVAINSIKFSNEKYPRKVAVVKVIKQEKGENKEKFILVSIGFKWPNNWISSQDINIKTNDTGRWLLQKDKTGLYILYSPDEFIHRQQIQH